jgi:hypothetical protein
MDADKLCGLIQDSLNSHNEEQEEYGEGLQINSGTYEEYGVMTNNKGLVLTINGETFQVTVMKN